MGSVTVMHTLPFISTLSIFNDKLDLQYAHTGIRGVQEGKAVVHVGMYTYIHAREVVCIHTHAQMHARTPACTQCKQKKSLQRLLKDCPV